MLTLIQANLLSFSLGPSFAGIGQIGSPGEPQSRSSAPPLSLRYQDLKSEPTAFDLLSWHTRVSDFIGREKEIEGLAAWASSHPAVLAQFVISEGGIGKSRLAAFFGELLKKDGWSAGFIDLRKSRSFPLKKKGILLIIDYPEENESGVKELLNDLAIMGNEVRLRVLFLTRQEMPAWDDIIMVSNSRTIMEKRPLILSPLSGTDPHDLYNSALRKAAALLKTSPPPLPEDALTEWLQQDIYHHSRALFIMALAVYSAMNPEETAVKYSGREVIEALAQREIERLYRIADKRQYQDSFTLARLLATASIADELSLVQIAALAQNTDLELDLPEGANIRRELKTTGILTEDTVHAPKPDIVAAAFLIKVLKENPETAPELVWTALENEIEGGLKRISRLSYDAEVVLNILNPRLSSWLAESVSGHQKRCALLEDFFTLSPPPLAWVEAAVSSRETLLKEVKDDERRAGLLNNLSNDLHFAGDAGGALSAIQESVEIRRRLAATNPARFNPGLAVSLNNLCNRLSVIGDTPDALKASQESVEIYRSLAAANPTRFDPRLAGGLNNLSNCLSAIGDTPGALSASQEAVEIKRRLAVASPARFNPDLAMSLNNLSLRLSDIGDTPGALKAIHEAVQIFDRLAAANPARFDPDLAASLNNLSLRLSDIGDTPGALKAMQEAVEIRRRLAGSYPARFDPDLAISLNNLSNRLSTIGDTPGALKACQESVKIRRSLAVANPARFDPDLAASLNNLSNRLSAIGDTPGALKAIQEAVEIKRRLAVASPARFDPDLAMSLNNLSLRLSDIGDTPGALKAIQEAVEIRRRLAGSYPARFEPDLATSLGVLGTILRIIGEFERAAEALTEGIKFVRPYAEQWPGSPATKLLAHLESDLKEMKN